MPESTGATPSPIRSARRWLLVAVLVVVGLVAAWFAGTTWLLARWTSEIARSTGHTSPGGLIGPHHKTRFVLWMGESATPHLKRSIDAADARMNGRIHAAWLLGKLGDHSRFDVFFEGLGSPRHADRYIAAVRMWDFPDECLQRTAQLVEAAGSPQHVNFWSYFAIHVKRLPLDRDSLAKVDALLGQGFRSEPLSPEEQATLAVLVSPR